MLPSLGFCYNLVIRVTAGVAAGDRGTCFSRSDSGRWGGRGEGQGPRRLRASWEKGTWLPSTCLFQLQGSRGPGADFRRFPVQVLRAGSCRGGEEGGVWACTWGARVQGGGGGCLLPSASLSLARAWRSSQQGRGLARASRAKQTSGTRVQGLLERRPTADGKPTV